MYAYDYDEETGGLLLNSSPLPFSKEPRPVYSKELDILGFDQHWKYAKDDSLPFMWAEANTYFYRGRKVAQTKGGSCYTRPEILLFEEPEPKGRPLRFIDIPAMVEKNKGILEGLTQETIKKTYNTYEKYKNKVDVFYVAFSGGKDSVVTLDIVQRALPHNAFMVLFGDTGMEFPDTYTVIKKTKKICAKWNVEFLISKSTIDPEHTWTIIGPPAQKMRWCCSVHKTAPQILLLRKVTKNPCFHGMAIMGVRSSESVSRSHYKELNYGTKHNGQYDYYPILEWNSAELFLYIYKRNLIFNETYKKGNSRAGCLVCPMEAKKNSWFKNQSYAEANTEKQTTTFFYNIIVNNTFAKTLPKEKIKEFMNIGIWKSRHNGSKLLNPRNLYKEEQTKNGVIISIFNDNLNWKEWFKTLGKLYYLPNNIINVITDDSTYNIIYTRKGEKQTFTIEGYKDSQKDKLFISNLKTVLRKSAYCIQCHVCEANCPYGYINMNCKEIIIDSKCVKCKKCYSVDKGCIVATSQMLPKESAKMRGSIDQYKNMGIRYQWVVEYFKKEDDFWQYNQLGSMMITALKTFLRHAEIIEKNKMSEFGKKISEIGIETATAWALILCNVVYTPQFNWWVKNIVPKHIYSLSELDIMLKDLLSVNQRKNVLSGFKNIFSTNPILSTEICFGSLTVIEKGGKFFLVDVQRGIWNSPNPKVILYSLYKFAEACGGYYQFTLTRLLNHEIDSDGVSPTEIFGLERKQMEELLTGLSINYPEFINASFTLDLDNITLRSEKSSKDVLALF